MNTLPAKNLIRFVPPMIIVGAGATGHLEADTFLNTVKGKSNL